MVIVAYLLQDDTTLSISDFTFLSLNENLSPQVNFNRLMLIFLGKDCGAQLYPMLGYLYWKKRVYGFFLRKEYQF
jgi:hypothetical protein